MEIMVAPLFSFLASGKFCGMSCMLFNFGISLGFEIAFEVEIEVEIEVEVAVLTTLYLSLVLDRLQYLWVGSRQYVLPYDRYLQNDQRDNNF